MAKINATQGIIYFLHAPELKRIKIGFTEHLKHRIKVLSSASPCKLELLKWVNGPYALEQILHTIFYAQRLHGEWFEITPALLEFIERLKPGEPLTPEQLILGKRKDC